MSLQAVGENPTGGGNDQTDDQGRFEMSGVAPGTYRANLWYQQDGSQITGQSEEFTVADGDVRSGIEITGAKRGE